jgi:DNA-binding PadR family transcriptional regulator
MSVRFALLGLLAQRSRHGYELHAAFEALMGGEQNWDVKPAQVYTTLSRLEEAGLVTEAAPAEPEGQDKRIYAVTPAGRVALSAWMATGVEREHNHDEFFLKLMLALLTGDPPPQRLIQTQRSALYRDLHAITTQRNAADPQRELARILLLDKAGMHLEADLRWLDMVEARIDEVKRQPPPSPEARPRGRPKKNKEIAVT